jgi:hypothetical protein
MVKAFIFLASKSCPLSYHIKEVGLNRSAVSARLPLVTK